MSCTNPEIEESQENVSFFSSLRHQHKDLRMFLLPPFPSLTVWCSGAAGAVRLWCSALAAVSRFRALFFREWWTPSNRHRRCTSLITFEFHPQNHICEVDSNHNHVRVGVTRSIWSSAQQKNGCTISNGSNWKLFTCGDVLRRKILLQAEYSEGPHSPF